MIQVVVKEPGKPAEAREIDGSVQSIQNAVGGYFEAHKFGGLVLYCNEGGYGLHEYMLPNVIDECHEGVLVGSVLVMKGDHGLPAHAIEVVKQELDRREWRD